MLKRLGATLAVVTLIATGCGDNKKSAQTITVQIDGKAADFNAAFTAYFPDKVSVHPGDTVVFNENWTGEPHTVTLGTLVNTGFANVKPNEQEEPAELKKLRDPFPQGPGDLDQTTANPCFLATGDLPASGPCPKAAQPEFDGTQALVSSGFLMENEKFTLKIAKDAKPGSYKYFCLLHRAAMQGSLTVVDSGTDVLTPDKVEQAATLLREQKIKSLGPAVAVTKQATADHAIAGFGAQDVEDGLIDVMAPKDAAIPVGGSMSWTVLGPHTISFGAPADAQGAIAKAPDGTIHLNPKALAPAGTAGVPPPSGPPQAVTVDGGTYNGTGFYSTGIMLSFPPALVTYKLKFTKAGTYQYKCLIHPQMEGTVKVG